MIQTEGFFPSTGKWLFYRCWYTTPTRGEIILIHGISEHSGRYQELAKGLTQEGYNLYGFDLSGHGRSEGKRGHIASYEELVVDIANFYSFLRIYRGVQNPVLLGHSLGGLLATLVATFGHCPIHGLILSAPLFKEQHPLSFWELLGLKMLNLVYPTFFIETRVDPALLTHDHNIVEEFTADPFVQHHISTRGLLEIRKAMKQANLLAPFIKVPTLILHGEEDQLNNLEGSQMFFDKLPGDKEFYIVPGGYHELFNEVGRGQIIAKTVQWLASKYKE